MVTLGSLHFWAKLHEHISYLQGASYIFMNICIYISKNVT